MVPLPFRGCVCAAVFKDQGAFLASDHIFSADMRSLQDSVGYGLVKVIQGFLVADHAAGMFDTHFFHFFQPDIAKADVGALCKMVTAAHTAGFFKEIGVFIGTDQFGIRKCFFFSVFI